MSRAATFATIQAHDLIAVARSWQKGVYPRHTELDQVTENLRLLMDILLSDAESRAAKLLEGSSARQTLADVVADTRRVITAGPGTGLCSAINHARALADAAERLVRDQKTSEQ